jgi:hypothetical protein
MRPAPLFALAVSLVVPRIASAEDAPLPPLPAPETAPAPTPAPAPATAPSLPTDAYLHDGLYFRFAAGLSFTSLWGDSPTGNASLSGGGISLLLALGGTLADGLVLGGMFDIAVSDSTSSSLGVAPGTDVGGGLEGLDFFADWYPNARGGWHVGAGVGFGFVALNLPSSQTLGGGDETGTVFGGYDGWIGQQWSAGVLLKATGGTRASLKFNDGSGEGYDLAAGSIALEGTVLLH